MSEEYNEWRRGMKLNYIKTQFIQNLPDHVLEEIINTATDIHFDLQKLVKEKNPNILLAALTWSLVAMIKQLVSDDRNQLEIAAKLTAESIILNMETLIAKMENKNGSA